MTLYGVQPGETYIVEITPYVTNCFSAAMSNFATAKVKIKSPVIGQKGKRKILLTHECVYNQLTYVCHLSQQVESDLLQA